MNTRALIAVLGALALAVACRSTDVDPAAGKNPDRFQAVSLADDDPDRFVPPGLDQRGDSAALSAAHHVYDTDEDAQPDSLPALPFGMTIAMLRDGDRLFHGRAGCLDCHGAEGEGLAARGKTLTAGLHFLPEGDWNAIDSLIAVGMPDAQTRSPIAMPPRGKNEDLTLDEIQRVGAYVWAISQARGEPWDGGHAFHAPHDWRASARTSIP